MGAPTHVRNTNARYVRTSASWVPQRNERHFRKTVAQTQNSSATKTSTQGSTRLKYSRHVRKMGAQTQHKARPQVVRPNATQGTSTSWTPQRNARHVRKLGAPTHVRNVNARHVHTSASWVPQRNARHIRKMVAQMQNSSARKMSTQGSTRLKDELEDG